MHKAINKMLELGKVTVENEMDFSDALSELPDKLTLEEAEAVLNIFDKDDDDDHSAFAWVWLDLIERVEGIKDSKILQNSKAY
jgi:hypothetical protein